MTSEAAVVRSIIQQNATCLQRHLILSQTVLDQLKVKGVIPDIVRRKIMMEPAHRQAAMLLECVERQSLASFKRFLDVLRHTGHGWLADHVMDTDVTVGHEPPPVVAPQVHTVDDIAHKYGSERYTSRPQVSFGSAPRPGILRNTAPAMPSVGRPPEMGLSLANLLHAREPPSPSQARGVLHARSLLSQPDLPDDLQLYASHMPRYDAAGRPSAPYASIGGDIPKTLYGLNQAFADQDQRHHHELSILQQEQTAIQQLMEQNARNQGQIRRKQQAVSDITDRIKDIHLRANDIYEPSPNPNIGRYRLHQLNQIPWQID